MTRNQDLIGDFENFLVENQNIFHSMYQKILRYVSIILMVILRSKIDLLRRKYWFSTKIFEVTNTFGVTKSGTFKNFELLKFLKFVFWADSTMTRRYTTVKLYLLLDLGRKTAKKNYRKNFTSFLGAICWNSEASKLTGLRVLILHTPKNRIISSSVGVFSCVQCETYCTCVSCSVRCLLRWFYRDLVSFFSFSPVYYWKRVNYLL